MRRIQHRNRSLRTPNAELQTGLAPLRGNSCARFANSRGATACVLRQDEAVQDNLLNALWAQRRAICDRWENLLRAERVITPLGQPDTLVFLMDWTLDEIFGELRNPLTRRRGARIGREAAARNSCPCGQNPLLAYFVVAERVLLEALVLTQNSFPGLPVAECQMAQEEMHQVVHEVGQREIAAFCGVCQHRGPAADRTSAMLEAIRG